MSSVYTLLGKAGGVLKVPRKTHAKKDAAAAEAFMTELASRLAAASVGEDLQRVRLWVLDEHRYGLASASVVNRNLLASIRSSGRTSIRFIRFNRRG